MGLPGRPVRVDACERARDDRVVAVTCSQDSREPSPDSRDVPEVSPAAAKKRARYHHAMTFVPVDDASAMRGEDETCLEHETGRDERALHEFVDYADEEIRFMCAWNETARRFAPLSERESGDLCVAFARTHAREMRENTVFFDQFLRTVLAMYEFGCVDRAGFVRAMRATRASGRRAEARRRRTAT